MKIITVGTDVKIFEKGRVYERIKEYSKLENIEKYFVFVFIKTPQLSNDRLLQIIDGNFVVTPIFSKNKLVAVFKLFWKIKKLKLENKNDIAISSQDPFEIGVISFLLSKIFKYKFLVQVHTDISSKYFKRESIRNYFQYLLSKFVIKKANSIRVVSNKIKLFLIEDLKIPEDKIFVAPVFANDLVSLPEGEGLRVGPKENTLLVLCRLEKVKNIELSIKSFLLLVQDKKYADYKLKIVGSGSQEKYLREKWGNYDNIIFENFTNDPFKEYIKAKLFLLTSWYEGWGMTPIESVSCGTPVVMTNVGCANEFIFDNLNGYICPNFKVKDYVATIKKALENYDTFTDEKLKNSLKMLQTKQEYLKNIQKTLVL